MFDAWAFFFLAFFLESLGDFSDEEGRGGAGEVGFGGEIVKEFREHFSTRPHKMKVKVEKKKTHAGPGRGRWRWRRR